MAEDKTKIKEVKAFARYIHVSPRKLRLVANLIKKVSVDLALEQLKFSSKNAALPLAKAINSAVANAVHNFDLKREDLYIKSLTIDGGPVYKRYAPRAQGRAFVERKRTSHINVVLEAKDRKSKPKRNIFAQIRRKQDDTAAVKDATKQVETGKVESKQQAPKQPAKPQEKIKKNLVDLKRRLFNRKSGS